MNSILCYAPYFCSEPIGVVYSHRTHTLTLAFHEHTHRSYVPHRYKGVLAAIDAVCVAVERWHEAAHAINTDDVTQSEFETHLQALSNQAEHVAITVASLDVYVAPLLFNSFLLFDAPHPPTHPTSHPLSRAHSTLCVYIQYSIDETISCELVCRLCLSVQRGGCCLHTYPT
jgi:hypothetical protein